MDTDGLATNPESERMSPFSPSLNPDNFQKQNLAFSLFKTVSFQYSTNANSRGQMFSEYESPSRGLGEWYTEKKLAILIIHNTKYKV